jgi:uncharacterized membrane protein YkvA (DUF1232 family)
MGNDIEKKEKKYNDFYGKLRAKINKWATEGRLSKKSGRWTDHFLQYLLVLPDMVHLMIKLLFDRTVPAPIKGYILVAFAYLVSPIDIIPDFIPVAGFVDDLLIMAVILNKIINASDEELLEKIRNLWAGEDDVFMKVKEIVNLLNDLSSQVPKAVYKFMKPKE